MITLEPIGRKWPARKAKTRVMEQRGRQFSPRLIARYGLVVSGKEMATWLAATVPATAATNPAAGRTSQAG